jgi:hypothetical protein
MERIAVHSGLSHFVLIDAITAADRENIAGYKEFAGGPRYLLVESLAQLGAFHLRFTSGFERHAFLLSIKHCSLVPNQPLDGCYHLFGAPTSCGSSAFAYRLRAQKADETAVEGEFLFAAVGYDDTFGRDILQQHYQKVFACLRSASKTGC